MVGEFDYLFMQSFRNYGAKLYSGFPNDLGNVCAYVRVQGYVCTQAFTYAFKNIFTTCLCLSAHDIVAWLLLD